MSNIALPGTGLIVRDRPWLGLVLVLLFGICGHAAIVGTWVAPRQWPGWITTTAWLLLAAVWILAQTLYYQYCVRSRAPIFKENANGPERSNSH